MYSKICTRGKTANIKNKKLGYKIVYINIKLRRLSAFSLIDLIIIGT